VGTIVIVSLISVATVLISADKQKQKQTDKIVEKIQMNEDPIVVPMVVSKKRAEDVNGTQLRDSAAQRRDPASNLEKERKEKSGEGIGSSVARNAGGDEDDDDEDQNLGERSTKETKGQKSGLKIKTPSSIVEENDRKQTEDADGNALGEAVSKSPAKLQSETSAVKPAQEGAAVGDGAAVAVAIGREIARQEEKENAESASPAEKELLHAARELNKPRRVAPGNQAKIERQIIPLTPEDAVSH